MKRYTRYVNRPAFGAAAGSFIVLALLFAFANIFHWLPGNLEIEIFLIRVFLAVGVVTVWVFLNIPPPKLSGFVIALVELAEEREPDGERYSYPVLRKTRTSFFNRRAPAFNPETGEEELKESGQEKPPGFPQNGSSKEGLNNAGLLNSPGAGAADGHQPGTFLAAAPEKDEGILLKPPAKKFTPPPALWKETEGARALTAYLKQELLKKFEDAGLTGVPIYDTDAFVTNRRQALREAEFPKAGVVIWGWHIFGTKRDFVPVVELPEPLEDKWEKRKQSQIIGLKSFDLGHQTARQSTIFSAFVSGLGAYAQRQYEKARSEFSLALVAAWLYSNGRNEDYGTDRTIIYFFLGNTHYYLKDYENAANSFREALVLDPQLYEARHNLGVVLQIQGKTDIAIRRLVEVIQVKPDLARARYNLGIAYFKKGQQVTARREFNNVMRLNPKLAAAPRAIGLSYAAERAFGQASTYFRQALQIDPRFAEVHVDLALLFYRQAEPALKKIREAEREARLAEQGRDKALIQQTRAELGQLKGSSSELVQLLDRATPELQKALAINPDLAEAHYYLGLILLQQNQEDQAGQSLLEAVRLRPDFADAYEVLADIYEARGRNDLRDKYLKLMGEARSATALTSAEALTKAGISFRLNGQLNQARETLEKALTLEPRNSKAQFELGIVYQELNEGPRAMELFQNVLKLPEPPDEVFECVARLFRQNGQEQQAFSLLQKAAETKPNSARLQYFLANAYRRQNEIPRAIEIFQKAISLDPQMADARFNLGLLFLAKRQLQDAALQFEEAVQLRPDDYTSYRYLGRALLDMRQVEEALRAFKQAVAIKDDALEARLEMGQIYLSRGDADEAREQFEIILKYDPNNMRARELLGKAFAQTGQLDMAMETFQNMLLVKPDSHPAHYNLGVALASQNRFEEAAREFHSVIKIRPDDADAHFNLGLAYDKQDKPYEAIDAFNRAIKYRPNFVEAYRYLGQVYFRINDMAAGLKAVNYAEQLKKG